MTHSRAELQRTSQCKSIYICSTHCQAMHCTGPVRRQRYCSLSRRGFRGVVLGDNRGRKSSAVRYRSAKRAGAAGRDTEWRLEGRRLSTCCQCQTAAER